MRRAGISTAVGKKACGWLYALVLVIDRKILGGVCGVIGAGGNIGGVATGLLLRGTGNPQLCFTVLYQQAVDARMATA